jgi:integrase
MSGFDARTAKLLQPGQHLTLDDAPGLRLEATDSSRSWIYRYKSPLTGQMKQVKIGNWPLPVSLAEAMGEWSKLKALRDSGRCPSSERKAARASSRSAAAVEKREKQSEAFTVGRLCSEFADYAAQHRKPKGAAELRRLFRTMLTADIASTPASVVSRSVAFALISSCADRPVVASSLRRELGAAWDWAVDSGNLPEDVPNWWRVILRGKLKSKGREIGGKRVGVQKVVLQPAQVGELIRFLPHMSRLPAELLTLYLWTGARGSEICAIEAREVTDEADGWWWTIPKEKTKMARHPLSVDLRVPLIGRALEIIRSRLDVHKGYLFPAINKSSRQPHVQQKVIGVAVWWHRPECEERPEQQRARFTIPHFSPHDLRRTVRTHLARLDCPDGIAEAVIGHMPKGIEATYNRHTYDVERRVWLTRLAESWEVVARR